MANLICPIAMQLPVDPVSAADGHVYERAAIARWHQRNRTSPMTGAELPSLVYTPDHALRAAIEESARGYIS